MGETAIAEAAAATQFGRAERPPLAGRDWKQALKAAAEKAGGRGHGRAEVL
jgi:hypothetical protein